MTRGGASSAGAPPPWSVERVHAWHRELRRLRFERKVAGVPPFVPEVRALERTLGGIRDLDRFLALLAEPPRTGESAADVGWRHKVFARMARDRGARVEALPVPSGWGRSGPRELPRPPVPPGEAGTPVRASERRRALRKAVARAVQRPTPERTHEVRQEIRRWEAYLSFRANQRGQAPPPRTRVAARVMSTLGTLHDLDRSTDLLRRLPRSQARARWQKEVRRERERRAARALWLLEKVGAAGIYATE